MSDKVIHGSMKKRKGNLYSSVMVSDRGAN
jgi:hypothetical protein